MFLQKRVQVLSRGFQGGKETQEGRLIVVNVSLMVYNCNLLMLGIEE